jgi:hypothetical protein
VGAAGRLGGPAEEEGVKGLTYTPGAEREAGGLGGAGGEQNSRAATEVHNRGKPASTEGQPADRGEFRL